MSKYQYVKEDERSYTIRHADGSDFQVAKQALEDRDHASVAALPRFAEGGEVQDAESEDVITTDPAQLATLSEPPTPPNPNEAAFKQRLDQRLAQKGALYGGIEQVPESSKQEAEAEALQDVATANKQAEESKAKAAASAASRTNRVEELKSSLGIPSSQPAAQAAPSIPTEQQVGAPSAAAEPEPTRPGVADQMQGVIGQMQRSIDTELKAKQDLAATQQKALTDQVSQQEQLNKQTAKNFKELADQSELLFKEASTGKIDANRYWSNQGTGDKILATIAVILGGIGGMGKGNIGLDIINKAIENDIEEQKANMGQKNNLYKMNLEKFRDKNQALMATQSQLIALTAAKMNLAAAQASSPLAKAEAERHGAALGEKSIMLQQQLAQQMARQQMLGGGSGDISGYLNSLPPEEAKSYRERIVKLPTGKEVLAYSPEAAKEVTTKATNFKNITDLVDRLDQVGPSALIPGSPSESKAHEIRSALVTSLKEMEKLGVLSGPDMALMDQRLRNPTTFKDITGGRAKSDSLRESLNNAFENAVSSSVPGYKKPQKIGTPYKGGTR